MLARSAYYGKLSEPLCEFYVIEKIVKKKREEIIRGIRIEVAKEILVSQSSVSLGLYLTLIKINSGEIYLDFFVRFIFHIKSRLYDLFPIAVLKYGIAFYDAFGIFGEGAEIITALGTTLVTVAVVFDIALEELFGHSTVLFAFISAYFLVDSANELYAFRKL